MVNGGRLRLTGDRETVLQLAELLLDGLDATERPRNNGGSAKRVSVYDVPIMGRPRSRKTAMVKVGVDERDGTAELKVEGGLELLLWQARTKTLCASCAHGRQLPAGWYLCGEFESPGRRKRRCVSYKFKTGLKCKQQPQIGS